MQGRRSGIASLRMAALLLAAPSLASPMCAAPSPHCIRGSPGTPGPGKSTLQKFTASAPQSKSIGACCAAAANNSNVSAVQLVSKSSSELGPSCWLMSDTALSKSTRITCTSAIVIPPAPAPQAQPVAAPAPAPQASPSTDVFAAAPKSDSRADTLFN